MAGTTQHTAAQLPPDVSLAEVARRVGACRWVEEQVFETLGGWVQSTPDPAAKIVFARGSQHAAWRAAQWGAIQSEIAGFDATTTTTPPNSAIAALFDTLHGAVGTDERVAAVGIVLASLDRDYAAWTSALSAASRGSVAAGPVLRVLRRVHHDLAADCTDVESLGPSTAPNDATERFVRSLDEQARSAGDITG